MQEYDDAKDLLEKTLASDIASFGEMHPEVARNQVNLAGVYLNLNEYEKARELLKQAYNTYIHIVGEEHPHTKNVISFLKRIEGK